MVNRDSLSTSRPPKRRINRTCLVELLAPRAGRRKLFISIAFELNPLFSVGCIAVDSGDLTFICLQCMQAIPFLLLRDMLNKFSEMPLMELPSPNPMQNSGHGHGGLDRARVKIGNVGGAHAAAYVCRRCRFTCRQGACCYNFTSSTSRLRLVHESNSR